MRYKDEVTKQIEYSKKHEGTNELLYELFSPFEDEMKLINGIEIEEELFYQTYSSEIEFEVFQNRINTLKLYLDQNKNFIDKFVQSRKGNLEKIIEKTNYAEISTFQGEAYYNIEKYFNEYLYVSIIKLLYSILETTLQNIKLLIEEKEGKRFKLSKERKSEVQKYIEIMEKDCNLNLELSDDFWVEFETFKKIRNKVTHFMFDEMLYEIKGNQKSIYTSYLNYEFCLENLGLVCEIIEKIELEICNKYPESNIFSNL